MTETARKPNRDNRPPLPLAQRELWRAADVAQVFGCSRKLVCDMNAANLLPAPVTLNRNVVAWRRRELLDWIDSGCPDRFSWKWRPAAPVKLVEFIALLQRQAAELSREVRELEERLETGETLVHVRKLAGCEGRHA